MSQTPIPEIPVDKPVQLPPRGSWPESVHLFDAQSAWAIRTALAAQRPLLVRGEPGTGKSQLARAAAEHLGRLFLSEVVHARSESQDLQWRYDAVARLGDAQVLAATHSTAEEAHAQLDHRNYLSPGPLWWVFDWQTASDQQARGGSGGAVPTAPEGWEPARGSVLLIDEIDKAEADLPNGLLETLGNGAFAVPWLDAPVATRADTPTPLVVITTNEERELPAAFVRRCLVLNLALPVEKALFLATLVERGKAHFQARCHAEVYTRAAELLWEDRQTAEKDGLPPPGQAEYFDLLRALASLSPEPAGQPDLLGQIADFALKKHPPRG